MIIDKAFTVYVLALTLGVTSVLTIAIVGQGGTFPSLGFMVEHLALGLTFRLAYKSLDGRDLVAPIFEFIGMATSAEPLVVHPNSAEAAA